MRSWASGTAAAMAGVGMALTVSLAGCSKVAPPTPLDRLDARQTHGHAVFAARCAACHYDRVDRPRHGPTLLGVYKHASLPSGAPANDDRVTATIEHGHGLMPAMGGQVQGDDLVDLLAYLHTL